MATPDVEASIREVELVRSAVARFERSLLDAIEQAPREIRRAVVAIQTEVGRRQDRLRAAEGAEAHAQEALAACTENCGGLQQAYAAARQEADRRRSALESARAALRSVEVAQSAWFDHLRSVAAEVTTHAPAAQNAAARYAEGLRGYRSMGSRSGGLALLGPRPDHQGRATGVVVAVSLQEIEDDGGIRSEADFEKVTFEQTVWGLETLKEVVEPAVMLGKGIEYFEARDRDEGRSGERSNAGVYRWFYGPSAIRLRPMPGGAWEVENGRHRVFAARRLGLDSLPART